MLNNKNIFLTGGTGSFGKKFIEMSFRLFNPNSIVVYSRDELKQYEMAQWVAQKQYPVVFKMGDVRDSERLRRCMHQMDIVIHAAALKHVPAAEQNPSEFIKTNIFGAQNVIEAALVCNVEKVVALSSDKACNPINLYGATKLASDKLFVSACGQNHNDHTIFSVVRYGNVIGSRGSVIPFFMNHAAKGFLPITDDRMTRFLITLEEGVELVFNALKNSIGGEVFVPKIPSMNIMDIAEVIAPGVEKRLIGIRPGEKLHEIMISEDDARNTLEFDSHYVVHNNIESFKLTKPQGKPVADDFRYASNTNPIFMTKNELEIILTKFELNGHELVYKDGGYLDYKNILKRDDNLNLGFERNVNVTLT